MNEMSKRHSTLIAAKLLVSLVMFVTIVIVGPGTVHADDVPLPAYAEVRSPKANVPPEYAAFLGRWSGSWRGGSDTIILHGILIVQSVYTIRKTPTRATVIYAWGVAPRWYIEEGGWDRVHGEFEDGNLVLHLGNGAIVIYRMRPDGTLRASYQGVNPDGSRRWPVWATMRRSKE